jgi:hypothetical protein
MQKGSRVLVRDHRAGVHVGEFVEFDAAAKTIQLSNARKVWYWSGAASVHGIAANGLSHSESKVAPSVTTVISTDVVEIVECSEKGWQSVMGCPIWEP